MTACNPETPVPVTSVSLNKTTLTLGEGGTETLIATVSPANASNKNVSWSSSNNTVATVNQTGEVIGVAVGTATITVTTEDGDKQDTCAVTIVQSYNSIASISTYLSAQAGGDTTATPIFLFVALNLGTMTEVDSNWRQLLTALNTAGKYVSLDLSACTMTGTEFGSPSTNNDKVVSITLPDGTASIDNYVFSRWTNLNSITIPSGLTSIGSYAFSDCTGLSSITLPANVSISNNPFRGCTSISFSVSGTGSLSTLENDKILVRNNTALVAYPSVSGSVTLPAGITSISSSAFENCTGLTSLTLPASTSFSIYAFRGCTSLSFTVTGSGSLSTLENGKILVRNNTELAAYPSASGSVILPTGFISIGNGAFVGCTGITSITLPAGLTTINDMAFDGCTNLESITLPDSLTSISGGAFQSCTSLESITLPDSLTSISNGAFWACSSLALVTCNATTPPTLGAVSVFHPNLSAIKVPAGSVAAYKTAENWSDYAEKISAIE